MKNKILFIILISMVLSGCSHSWKNKIQISELKYEDNYIVGKIRNVDSKAYDLTMTFKLKSGSLTETETCFEIIKPNETKDLSCLAYDYDETYDITVENIELNEYSIPNLETGKIDVETLKYHFEDIYDNHILDMISFHKYNESGIYPYIREVTYQDNEITIDYSINNNDNDIIFREIYDSSNSLLKQMIVIIISKDDEFIQENTNNIALMSSLNLSSIDALKMRKALNDDTLKPNEGIIVSNWVVSKNLNTLNDIKDYEYTITEYK